MPGSLTTTALVAPLGLLTVGLPEVGYQLEVKPKIPHASLPQRGTQTLALWRCQAFLMNWAYLGVVSHQRQIATMDTSPTDYGQCGNRETQGSCGVPV